MIEWRFVREGGSSLRSAAVVESVRKGGDVAAMNRAVRALAILALGWGFVLAPLPAVTGSPVVAVAQQPAPPPDGEQPPPAPPPEQSEMSPEERQRYVVGGVGAALIVVVLVSRKVRGKSVIGLKWRKRG